MNAGIAWAVAIVGLLGYEVWAIATKKKGETLSEAVWRWNSKYPYIPFAFGLLMGHLFWRKNDSAMEDSK